MTMTDRKNVYAVVTVRLVPGKHDEFVRLLNAAIPTLAKYSVRLVGSYSITLGELYKVVDIWEGPNIESISAAFLDPAVWGDHLFSSILAAETTEFAELTVLQTPPAP